MNSVDLDRSGHTSNNPVSQFLFYYVFDFYCFIFSYLFLLLREMDTFSRSLQTILAPF